LLASGVANNAREAVRGALNASGRASIDAAAIDGPLFWSHYSDRVADKVVRDGLKHRRAPSPAGTVQTVNSLRGACLAQGILAATALRDAAPGIAISESHPKALLWLLGVATAQRPTATIRATDLRRWIATPSAFPSEHERDAALGVLSALAMVSRPDGWTDLAALEANVYRPVDDPLGYWMPLDSGGQAAKPVR